MENVICELQIIPHSSFLPAFLGAYFFPSLSKMVFSLFIHFKCTASHNRQRLYRDTSLPPPPLPLSLLSPFLITLTVFLLLQSPFVFLSSGLIFLLASVSPTPSSPSNTSPSFLPACACLPAFPSFANPNLRKGKGLVLSPVPVGARKGREMLYTSSGNQYLGSGRSKKHPVYANAPSITGHLHS